ncbi:hypothetical protein Tco_0324224 [Tanacetum coccineum]
MLDCELGLARAAKVVDLVHLGSFSGVLELLEVLDCISDWVMKTARFAVSSRGGRFFFFFFKMLLICFAFSTRCKPLATALFLVVRYVSSESNMYLGGVRPLWFAAMGRFRVIPVVFRNDMLDHTLEDVMVPDGHTPTDGNTTCDSPVARRVAKYAWGQASNTALEDAPKQGSHDVEDAHKQVLNGGEDAHKQVLNGGEDAHEQAAKSGDKTREEEDETTYTQDHDNRGC